ncbi:DUF305 domain-containing protein [Kitasatospora sp. NPDC048296]|uniref:DUF305 domain-containing protein n=1 Tax=Kitasatospora sp. NPDC048296 TaxID=3364048 RepID=UPI003711E3B6
MATHHQQAVDLSFIVRDRTTDPEVRQVAFDVINAQANQRGMLTGRLDQWHLTHSSPAVPMARMHMDPYQAHDGSLMPGMATNTEMDQLRSASGKQAEILYLQLMIDHHKGGVVMAQGYLALARNPAEKRLAQTIVASQVAEIDMMTRMLAERGAQPRNRATAQPRNRAPEHRSSEPSGCLGARGGLLLPRLLELGRNRQSPLLPLTGYEDLQGGEDPVQFRTKVVAVDDLRDADERLEQVDGAESGLVESRRGGTARHRGLGPRRGRPGLRSL